ncbi:MAG: hypothetical protein HQM07_09655, partial [Zetaproteobacteria bacterium]|nr:hypothetical protein [Zetaproteobacteria bacterium]
MKKQAWWAIVDQGAVSGMNFLTIAMGAYLLTLSEQTKLVYLYTGYIGLVLLNAALIFSAAPILYHECVQKRSYLKQLLRMQVLVVPVGALLFVAFFYLIGPFLEWLPTNEELLWTTLFLVFQQLSDFNRRADYIFGAVKSGALLSLIMFIKFMVTPEKQLPKTPSIAVQTLTTKKKKKI